MEFNELLKKARVSAGLTQQQIANRVGITKSTYCGYETGKRNPDPPRIAQLAAAIGVSPNTFFADENEKSPEPYVIGSEDTEKWLTDLLVDRGYIKKGEDISDRDADFLIHVIGLIDAWFSK